MRTSWRIHFEFHDDDVRPVSARRIAMIAPGGASPPKTDAEGGVSGAWIEMVGAEGGEPWARVIHQPNSIDREAFLEGGGITRVKRDAAKGVFDVVVPDLGGNATFRLYLSPADAPERAAELRLKLSASDLVALERGQGPDRTDPDSGPGGRDPAGSGPNKS